MPREEDTKVTLNLRLSPGLYAQIRLAAKTAGKPIDSTIKSLLWIGLGALNLKAHRGSRPE